MSTIDLTTTLTTSTTAQMAIRHLMTPDPFTIEVNVPLHTAAVLLEDLDVSGAPVVDAAGALVGVLTRRDLLEALLMPAIRAQDPMSIRRWWSRKVGEVCSRPARCTSPDASVADAAAEMVRHRIGRLVVVDGTEIVGIVSARDVLDIQ